MYQPSDNISFVEKYDKQSEMAKLYDSRHK